jgi:hypothetical protein
MNIKIFLIISIILLAILYLSKIQENNGTGALVQLAAKGPQDLYLTGTNSLYPYYYPSNPYYYPMYYPYYSRKYWPRRHRHRYRY